MDSLSNDYHTRDMAKFVKKGSKITAKRQSKWGNLMAIRLALDYVDFTGTVGLQTLSEILLVNKNWRSRLRRFCWKKLLVNLEMTAVPSTVYQECLGGASVSEREKCEEIRIRAWENLLEIVRVMNNFLHLHLTDLLEGVKYSLLFQVSRGIHLA